MGQNGQYVQKSSSKKVKIAWKKNEDSSMKMWMYCFLNYIPEVGARIYLLD